MIRIFVASLVFVVVVVGLVSCKEARKTKSVKMMPLGAEVAAVNECRDHGGALGYKHGRSATYEGDTWRVPIVISCRDKTQITAWVSIP